MVITLVWAYDKHRAQRYGICCIDLLFFFFSPFGFFFLKSLISPLLFSHFFFNFLSFHSVLSHDLTRKRSKAAKKETFFLCFVSLSHNVFSVSISFPLSEWYICHCRSFQALLFLFQKTQKGLCLYESRLGAVCDLRSFLVLFWMALLLCIGLQHASNLSLSCWKVKNNNTNIFLLLINWYLSNRNRSKSKRCTNMQDSIESINQSLWTLT